MKTAIYAVSLILSFTVLAAADGMSEDSPTFDPTRSDPRAVEIADEVLAALGGQSAWDSCRYLTWNFFGRRFHVWDKATGDFRVESGGNVFISNTGHPDRGRAWIAGRAITDPDSLSELLTTAHGMWVNDSYWLFMPFKLKDPGVVLRYDGESFDGDGNKADVIEMTFYGVGFTPENKYHVFVDRQTKLVTQWEYYQNATMELPGLTTPWRNWKNYGPIKLSDDRGKSKFTEVSVRDEVPAHTFTAATPLLSSQKTQRGGR